MILLHIPRWITHQFRTHTRFKFIFAQYNIYEFTRLSHRRQLSGDTRCCSPRDVQRWHALRARAASLQSQQVVNRRALRYPKPTQSRTSRGTPTCLGVAAAGRAARGATAMVRAGHGLA